MLRLNIEVVLENAQLVKEENDVRILRYEELNNPATFKRVLRHLQLERKAPPFPMVVFISEEEAENCPSEFPIEYGSKNLEFLIGVFEKLEDRILKEWAKFEEKLAKAKAKGKEPDVEPPVDSVRYVITARVKGDEIEELVFDKMLISTLMPNKAITLRYVARLKGEEED